MKDNNLITNTKTLIHINPLLLSSFFIALIILSSGKVIPEATITLKKQAKLINATIGKTFAST
jgi:hypothetical protein